MRIRRTILGLLLTVTCVAAVACSEDEAPAEVPTPSTRATLEAASTEPSTVPPSTTLTETPPPSLPSLPGQMQEVIAAALDGGTYIDHLEPTQAPCRQVEGPSLLRPAACPEGAPEGTEVPAYARGGCPDRDIQFLATNNSIEALTITDLGPLIGVVDLDVHPVEYVALFGGERVVWLGFDGKGRLIGLGGGGSCAAFELRDRLWGSPWLVGPNWNLDGDEPPLWEALVRPVSEGGAEEVVRRTATVPALCSFHGAVFEVCERQGKGANDHFDGIIVSDVMFCEACAQAPEDAVATLAPVFAFGPLELEGVWRVTPNIGTRLAEYRDGLTASVAVALRVPDVGDADRPTGFLLYVDPTLFGDPDAQPISAIELLTPSWTGFDAAEYLGAWERLYPVP